MRLRQGITIISLSGGLVGGTADAQTTDSKAKAYGSRVGDRDADPNNAGLSGDQRTSRRIETRIDSRLQTRLDRFTVSQDDYSSSYTPKPDDQTSGTR